MRCFRRATDEAQSKLLEARDPLRFQHLDHRHGPLGSTRPSVENQRSRFSTGWYHWADLEAMQAAGCLDVEAALGVLARYLGSDDDRLARVRSLA